MSQYKLHRLHRRASWMLTLAAGLLGAANVHAQSGGGYELKNAAFASGSGSATNGAYRMTAMFTPSASGALTNAGYSFKGAFVSVGLVQTTGAPLLRIIGSGANAILAWPDPSTGFTLQSTPAIAPANWTDVAQPVVVVGNEKTVTVPATGPYRFYRLFKP